MFVQEINGRGWQVLVTPPDEININIIRKFYVNVRPTGEDAVFSRTSWVRGRIIPYDVIHDYLEDTFEASQEKMDSYSWEVQKKKMELW